MSKKESTSDDAAMRALFTKSAAAPDDAQLNRMLARAKTIPGETRPHRRLVAQGWRSRPWLPAALATTMVAVLSLGVWNSHRSARIEPTPDVGHPGTPQWVERDTPSAGRTPGLAQYTQGGATALADPLAGLDTDWDVGDDSMALLDPPHMVFSDVDTDTWLEVYSGILEAKNNL